MLLWHGYLVIMVSIIISVESLKFVYNCNIDSI